MRPAEVGGWCVSPRVGLLKTSSPKTCITRTIRPGEPCFDQMVHPNTPPRLLFASEAEGRGVRLAQYVSRPNLNWQLRGHPQAWGSGRGLQHQPMQLWWLPRLGRIMARSIIMVVMVISDIDSSDTIWTLLQWSHRYYQLFRHQWQMLNRQI